MTIDNNLYSTTIKRVYDDMGDEYFFEVSTDEVEFGEVRLSYWEKDHTTKELAMKESFRVPLNIMHYICEIIKKDFPLASY